VLALFLGLGSGCAYVAPAHVPIDVEWAHGSIAPRKDLVVFLPGIGDAPEDFVAHDFVRLLQARHPNVDAVLVGAYFNYYRSGSIVTRLYDDVILPAKKQGYERIYVVGISLGGLGAVSLATEHPDAVDGLLLLSPYLGEQDVVGEIERAGGLAKWSRGTGGKHGLERRVRDNWAFLKAHARGTATPRLLLGYGTEDRFSRALDLLAVELPQAQVRTRPGIHDWKAWTPLYVELLDQLVPRRPPQGDPRAPALPAPEGRTAVTSPSSQSRL
jgi:pimeloyl-ACP methyl ester carboxylesterase